MIIRTAMTIAALLLVTTACSKETKPAKATAAKTQTALERGQAFLAANEGKPGIITTSTGLQYKVLASGPKDGISPKPGQYVCAHYHGTFLDGKVFDSSFDRDMPVAFRSDQLIGGWVEALQLMRPGDDWQLYVPANLAYGHRGTGDGTIGPDETLIFRVKLIKVLDIDDEKYNRTYRINPTLDCSVVG